MDVDRDDSVEVDGHRSSSLPSLITGPPGSARRVEPVAAVDFPDPGRHDLARENGSGEPDSERPGPGSAIRRLEDGTPGEGHRAEAVHDATREARQTRELVVEMDREMVARCPA